MSPTTSGGARAARTRRLLASAPNMVSESPMEPLIRELVEMRRRARPGSAARRLAEHCLELALQELCANDERFAQPPRSIADELAQVIAGAWT